jgi:hypothetical protein
MFRRCLQRLRCARLAALCAAWLLSASGAKAAEFVRGDVDSSGRLDLHDSALIASYLDRQVELPCLDAADVDDDGAITPDDIARLVAHLAGGSSPAAPFPALGADATPDVLDCSDATPIEPIDGSDVVLEYEFSDRAHRGLFDIDVFVTPPRALRAIELSLGFGTDSVNHVRAELSDSLKGVGRYISAPSADGSIAVLFGIDRSLPAGERTRAFTLSFCIRSPTPTAGWDLPIDFRSVVYSFTDGAEAALAQPDALSVRIPFGLGLDSRQAGCFRAPPIPDFFRCTTRADGSVLLEWENPGTYDEFHIDAGLDVVGESVSRRIIELPGDASSWIDEVGGADHNYVYKLNGTVLDDESIPRHSEWTECAAQDPRDAIAFLRGDVNQDGTVSTADALSLQRWMFGEGPKPGCNDAADVDDDGEVSIVDIFAIPFYLYGIGASSGGAERSEPAMPFPAIGFDPTHGGESIHADCLSYIVQPSERTDDTVRLGQVAARPGEIVEVPIYLSNSRPIESIQLVVRYDSTRLSVLSGPEQISFDDSFFTPLIEQRRFTTSNGWFTWDGPHIAHIQAFPEDGYFTLGIVGSLVHADRFAVTPGEDTIIGRIRVQVSGDVSVGSILTLTPEDGPDGTGYGRFGLRGELSIEGEGRLATIRPTSIEGAIALGVDGDVSFFIRGDANDDRRVDVSDAIFTLDYLFLGGDEPECADAADADDSGEIELTDAVVTLSTLFLGGVRLPHPFPNRGIDEVPDFLPICR